MSRLAKCVAGACGGVILVALSLGVAAAQPAGDPPSNNTPPPKQPNKKKQPEKQPPKKDAPEKGPDGRDLSNCPEKETRPWACGVSQTNQSKALVLFTEGNSLVNSTLFANAVEKYREALKYWKHPAIYYNLALAMIFLKDPVNVYRALEKAVVYGPKPLGKENFDHANKYRQLIKSQLSWLNISCNQPGARVSLDNEELFVCPGRKEIVVKAGKHTLVARKKGYIGGEVRRVFGPAEKADLNMQLFTEADLTRERRKWTTWKPWAVVGGGVVVAGIGAIVHMLAKNGFQDFDKAIASCGDTTPGCQPDQTIRDMRSSAETKQTLAITSYVIGGAAVAAGFFLVYMNRAQPYRVSVEEHRKSLGLQAGRVNILPVIGRHTAGVGASFDF